MPRTLSDVPDGRDTGVAVGEARPILNRERVHMMWKLALLLVALSGVIAWALYRLYRLTQKSDLASRPRAPPTSSELHLLVLWPLTTVTGSNERVIAGGSGARVLPALLLPQDARTHAPASSRTR